MFYVIGHSTCSWCNKMYARIEA